MVMPGGRRDELGVMNWADGHGRLSSLSHAGI